MTGILFETQCISWTQLKSRFSSVAIKERIYKEVEMNWTQLNCNMLMQLSWVYFVQFQVPLHWLH